MLQRIPRAFLVVPSIAVVIIATLWATQGRDAAEKVGTALMMPAGLLWLLLMCLTTTYWPLRFRRSNAASESSPPRSWMLLLCFILYSLAGSGLISDALARNLEAPYLSVNPLTMQIPDVVIVLGGGAGAGANDRIQGNMSGDRLILAAQLYHQNHSIKFICTGKRIQSMDTTGVDPGQASRDLLIRLGVPADSIELLGGKNTSEEMKSLATRFGSDQKVGLLTSAWHMPRATRLAERNGLNVVPLPADFRTAAGKEGKTPGQWVEALIPNGGAMGAIWSFAKEYVGMAIGR